MSVTAVCRVCGGHLRPVDGQSPFQSCDSCGLVYALGDRAMDPSNLQVPRVEMADRGGTADLPGSRWTCPDCGAELEMSSEMDLQFARREHIREYHPNRPVE